MVLLRKSARNVNNNNKIRRRRRKRRKKKMKITQLKTISIIWMFLYKILILVYKIFNRVSHV
jgi:hypothetical protein